MNHPKLRFVVNAIPDFIARFSGLLHALLILSFAVGRLFFASVHYIATITYSFYYDDSAAPVLHDYTKSSSVM